MKSTGLLLQLLMHLNNSEYLVVTLDETIDESKFEQYSLFLYYLCKKMNVIAEVYCIKKWPVCADYYLGDHKNATFYWLSSCLRKANALLPVLRRSEMNHPVLHNELISMLVKANSTFEKIEQGKDFD